jgi:hypothetical protein
MYWTISVTVVNRFIVMHYELLATEVLPRSAWDRHLRRLRLLNSEGTRRPRPLQCDIITTIIYVTAVHTNCDCFISLRRGFHMSRQAMYIVVFSLSSHPHHNLLTHSLQTHENRDASTVLASAPSTEGRYHQCFFFRIQFCQRNMRAELYGI